MMRPIFCGNFEYDARQSDLERLFRRYGKVDRVDMKSGKYSKSLYVPLLTIATKQWVCLMVLMAIVIALYNLLQILFLQLIFNKQGSVTAFFF